MKERKRTALRMALVVLWRLSLHDTSPKALDSESEKSHSLSLVASIGQRHGKSTSGKFWLMVYHKTAQGDHVTLQSSDRLAELGAFMPKEPYLQYWQPGTGCWAGASVPLR